MRALVVILILLLSQPLYAEDLKNLSEVKSLSKKMMEMFIREDFKGGLDIAKKYWPLSPVEIDNLANQIQLQWSVVKQRFGNTIGYEFIKEEKIGNSFVRFFYLQKFEKHAIYWIFTYYRPKNRWIINQISFKDDLDPLFEHKQ